MLTLTLMVTLAVMSMKVMSKVVMQLMQHHRLLVYPRALLLHQALQRRMPTQAATTRTLIMPFASHRNNRQLSRPMVGHMVMAHLLPLPVDLEQRLQGSQPLLMHPPPAPRWRRRKSLNRHQPPGGAHGPCQPLLLESLRAA